ncbi:MAG TPA: hypothetical protein VN808_02030 [Stellaceae bacterium]|nr:hypothetical protein [Stellaceae bacterium]
MSLGTVLDVVIGLAFTYLLLGIIASGFQEVWVACSNKRGKELQNGIIDLLAGSGPLNLANKVFNHALVFGLSPGTRAPSYVPARNFTLAVLDTLRAGGQGPVFSEIEKTVAALPDGAAKQSLASFITDAAGDLDKLQKSIETWFDDAMDRVSGVYKRYSQIFTLIFGLAAAVIFNVNSVNLAYTLWTNGPLRDAAVKAAQQYDDAAAKQQASPAGQQTTGDPAKAQAQAQKKIEDAVNVLNQLPIGWIATAAETQNGNRPGALNLF